MDEATKRAIVTRIAEALYEGSVTRAENPSSKSRPTIPRGVKPAAVEPMIEAVIETMLDLELLNLQLRAQ